VLEKIRRSQRHANPAASAAAAASIEGATASDNQMALVPAMAKLSMASVELPDLSKDVLSPYDDGIEGNPVGELQELCMNRRMQPPVYEVGQGNKEFVLFFF